MQKSKGIFIPDITVEMFRNGCLEGIETLMAEGEVYDIEYDPKTAEQDVPDNNVGELISRQAAIDVCNIAIDLWTPQLGTGALIAVQDRISRLPSVEPRKGNGKWIKDNPHYTGIYKYACSECKAHHRARYDFCPSCGSDMREGDSE